jgi:hypothetical protein
LGKRASAVAFLLATSFLGSLLALVLVGRNPLVGPPTDLATPESLAQEVRGRAMMVPPASLSPAVLAPDASEAAPPRASEVARPGSAETDPPAPDRTGAGGDEDEAVDAAPPVPEPAPTAEDDVVVSKVAPSMDGKVGKADKPKGSSNKKEDGGGASKGSSSESGSKGGPKEKGSGKGPKEDKVSGSGKGPKTPKGSGNGASVTPGNGKGNGRP